MELTLKLAMKLTNRVSIFAENNLELRALDLSNSGGNAFNDLGYQTSSSNEFHVEDLCYEPKLDYKISAILDMLQALERIDDFKNGSMF